MSIVLMILSHWGFLAGGVGAIASVVGLGAFAGPAALLVHWKAVVAAVVTLVLAAVAVFLYIDLQHVKVAAATAAANYQTVLGQNTTLNADNQNLVAQLKTQSQSIQDAASAAFALQAASKAALLAALAQQATDASKIASLKARAANSKTNQGSCDDEIAFLRAGL